MARSTMTAGTVAGVQHLNMAPSQAMLHAPLLRQFFLSEGHPAGGCRRSPSAHPCLSCELVLSS